MQDRYAAEFNYKIINDPIYGCINLSETEVRLLDTHAMQRLRRIRQMGFANYVFPSGEHSRFVHSLGVLYIIGKMCEHFYRLYNNENNTSFTIEDARKIRIAALLHDVGHFPFSHLSECVYSYIENVKSTAQMIQGVSEPKDSNLLSEIANFKKLKEKDHEHLGAAVIANDSEIVSILEEKGISADEIGQIIVGDTQAKPIYAQMLHSSLDADRLDYLLRDSRQAGVSFGSVELEYILRQMRIKKVCLKHDNGSEEIIELVVFDTRAQHAIEHFLMARFFHYSQVVQHKTSTAFEAVAKALEYKVLTDMDTPYKDYDSIKMLIGTDEFYNFTDDYMWELIKNYASSSNDNYVETLWDCLSKRKKPNHILTISDIIPKKAASPSSAPVNDSVFFLAKWIVQNMQEELAGEAGVDSEFIGYVNSEVYLESIPSHLRAEDCSIDHFPDEIRGAIRLVDHKDERISFLASDNKSLINKMVDYTSNTLDVFYVGSIDSRRIEKLNEAIITRARKK